MVLGKITYKIDFTFWVKKLHFIQIRFLKSIGDKLNILLLKELVLLLNFSRVLQPN